MERPGFGGHTLPVGGCEHDCRGNTLVAEMVPQSIEELGIREGSEVVAVIKASAFKRMY